MWVSSQEAQREVGGSVPQPGGSRPASTGVSTGALGAEGGTPGQTGLPPGAHTQCQPEVTSHEGPQDDLWPVEKTFLGRGSSEAQGEAGGDWKRCPRPPNRCLEGPLRVTVDCWEGVECWDRSTHTPNPPVDCASLPHTNVLANSPIPHQGSPTVEETPKRKSVVATIRCPRNRDQRARVQSKSLWDPAVLPSLQPGSAQGSHRQGQLPGAVGREVLSPAVPGSTWAQLRPLPTRARLSRPVLLNS